VIPPSAGSERRAEGVIEDADRQVHSRRRSP